MRSPPPSSGSAGQARAAHTSRSVGSCSRVPVYLLARAQLGGPLATHPRPDAPVLFLLLVVDNCAPDRSGLLSDCGGQPRNQDR